MAQHSCSTPSCKNQASGRNIFCAACWSKIPAEHQKDVRAGTKEGTNALRAAPSREWLQRAWRFAGSAEKVKGANLTVTEQVTKV